MASAYVENDPDPEVPHLVGDVDQDTEFHDFDLGRSMGQSFRSIQSDDVPALEVSEELVMENQEETDKNPNTTRQVRRTYCSHPMNFRRTWIVRTFKIRQNCYTHYQRYLLSQVFSMALHEIGTKQ